MIQQKLPKLVQDTIDWYINQEYLKEWKGKMSEVCEEYQRGTPHVLHFGVRFNLDRSISNPKDFNYRKRWTVLGETTHLEKSYENIMDINGKRVALLSPNYYHQKLYP